MTIEHWGAVLIIAFALFSIGEGLNRVATAIRERQR